MRVALLSSDNSDNENNHTPIYKAKIIARMNGSYTEILIDTGAKLSVLNHKFISKHNSLSSLQYYLLIIYNYKLQ